MHRETCKFIDGHPKVQPLAIRVKGGATKPQAVVRLIFINADLTRRFFRSVNRVLPTAKCRMVSAAEASQMRPIGLRQDDVFSMVGDDRVGGGVERRGAGASDNASERGVLREGSSLRTTPSHLIRSVTTITVVVCCNLAPSKYREVKMFVPQMPSVSNSLSG